MYLLKDILKEPTGSQQRKETIMRKGVRERGSECERERNEESCHTINEIEIKERERERGEKQKQKRNKLKILVKLKRGKERQIERVGEEREL
jgi:hypothetical protein